MGVFNPQKGLFRLYKQSSVSMKHAIKMYAGVVVHLQHLHEGSGKSNSSLASCSNRLH